MSLSASPSEDPVPTAPRPMRERTIVLVGLMGAGKTTVGRRLAKAMALDFVDADEAIEEAAGMSVADYFEHYGEPAFREGERKVIRRLLTERNRCVLATGGGAFMDGETRDLIRSHGLSVWLRADLDLLVKRTSKRNTRPLLRQGNPREILQRLMDERYPVYAEADITIDTADVPHDEVVEIIISALKESDAS